ncbi:hypothetical protein [Pseudomonas chlororaphis]
MDISNLEKYRKDLDALLSEASTLAMCLTYEASPDRFRKAVLKSSNGDEEKAEKFLKGLPSFKKAYHHWYSEAVTLVKQLLPDRLNDFVRLYERPKTRKTLDAETYRIEDACQGLQTSRLGDVLASMQTAIPLLDQQIAIVESIKRRFESSLFDIKQLVQADLYDSELDTSRGLLKSGFARAAGAIAGVVLEGHLKEVRDKHDLPKKLTTITPIIEALRAANIIELSQHRQIQFLGDIRNKCGHKSSSDPTSEEVTDLINGVDKVIKTIF